MNRVCEAFTEHDGKLVGRQFPRALQHLPIFFNIAQGQQYQLGGRFTAREMAAILNDLPKAWEHSAFQACQKNPPLVYGFLNMTGGKKYRSRQKLASEKSSPLAATRQRGNMIIAQNIRSSNNERIAMRYRHTLLFQLTNGKNTCSPEEKPR